MSRQRLLQTPFPFGPCNVQGAYVPNPLAHVGVLSVKHRLALLVLFLSLAVPALAGERPAAIDKTDVVQGLILGRDQSAAVALLRSRDQRAAKPTATDRLFADFQRDLELVLAWAAEPHKNAAPPSASLDRLEASAQLLERRFAKIEATLKTDLPARIRARQDQALAAHKSLFALLRQLRAASADPAKRAALPELAERLRKHHAQSEDQPPILRASLPYERALASAAPLPNDPAILPSYQNPAAAPATAADLSHSDDAALSPVIIAQAQALEYDYVRIFDFVRSQIRTELYAGSMKGAEATLRARAGNDVDQASLLIALFRASGLPARFVQGIVHLPVAAIGQPLGLSDGKAVIDALARAGVPHQAVLRGREVVELRLFHTWVSAYVPYAHYRGTTVDVSGRAWLPLDAAVKTHTLRPATDLVGLSAFPGLTFPDSYLAGDFQCTPLEAARTHFETYLLAHPELGPYQTQLAALAVDQAPLALLPASLPYPVDLVSRESATLSADQHHRLRIVATALDGQVVMDQTLNLNRLLDHRLTLSYEPATVDDHNLIQRFYTRSNVPAYLVRLRPQLNLDGLPAAVGSGDLGMGLAHRLSLTLDGPAGSRGFEQTLVAGGYAAIGLDAQLGQPPQLEAELPGDREQQAARLLHNQVSRYLTAWDQAERELADLYDLALVHPRPSMALLFSRFDVQTSAGLPMSLDFQGVALDAPIRAAAPLSRLPREDAYLSRAAEAEQAFMRLSGLQGSALESDIFSRHWGVTAVSGDAGLIAAAHDGIQVLTVTAANLGTMLAQLEHPAAVRAELSRLVGLGYEVRIPIRQIDLAAWHGSVWAAFEPPTGASGYFIAGGLAGGETAEPPADWMLEELADLLGNPYDGEPNTDPLAAARIRRLPGADGQLGVAGEALEQPLTVLVTDRYGRPVAGAQVAFRITLGGGQLEGGSSEAITATDNFGIAKVSMTLNQKTGENPIFAYLESGDQYPSQLGEAWINAAVASFNGAIGLDLPFIVYAKPGEPANLRRPDEDNLGAAPSGWAGPVFVHVEDQYGNPISNAEVTFSGAGTVNHTSCQASPSPLTFFREGDCNVPVTPGSPCGQSSLTLTSTLYGVHAQVINGDTGGVEYKIQISSAGTPGVSLSSFAYGSCSPTTYIYLQSLHYATSNGKISDAAKPGEVTALARRANLAYGLWVMDGDTPIYNKYVFYPTEGALSFDVAGGGVTGLTPLGGGTYEGALQVGASPGLFPVTLRADNFYYQYRESSGAVRDGNTSFSTETAPVYAVTPEIIEVVPDPIILDLDGRSRVGFIVNYLVQPLDYDGRLLVNLYENGQLKMYRYRPQGPNQGSVVFPPGLDFDLHANYEVELVVNPNDAFEITSERVPFKVTQQIFSHVANDVIPDLSSNMPVGGGPVSNNAVGPPLAFFSDYDIPNMILCEVPGMSFGTTQGATVSLIFERLDEDGEPDGYSVELLDEEHLGEGDHPVILPLRSRMGEGTWRYTLTGIADSDGHSDSVVGKATISVISRNALPVGHATVKGVDLFDGTFTHSKQDLLIPGKGNTLEFSHSYISSAREQPGIMGFGWSHNYLSSVNRTRCGDFIVSGAEGGSMRFVPEGDGFRPLKGYHGTLIQNADGSFEYYPPGGTKYVFVKLQPNTWWLQTIEDNNGNRTELTYQQTLFAPLLQRVTDAAGRTLSFTYEHRNFGLWSGDVLTGVSGPGGIMLTFTYDDLGNLTNAARPGASSETYSYQPFSITIGHHLLSGINDDVGGGARTYQFRTESFEVAFSNTNFSYTTPIVESLTERDGSGTGFTYVPGPNGGFSSATITDGRGQSITYTMNEYGAATAISGAAGTYSVSWDMNHVVKSSSIDANGNATDYGYDDEANLTSESVGGKTRTYTYYGSGSFDHPIKNLPSSYTDRAGRRTTYSYDSAGNLISENKGGFVTNYAYDGSGNRIAKIDAAGNVTNYTYDGYGYLTGETDPTGAKRTSSWDVRGRQLTQSDGLGQVTSYTYDQRDRRTSERRPGGVNLRTEYDDGARTKTETDANSNVTVTSYDAMGRTLSVRNPLGYTSTLTYDGNGNKTSETDFAGRATTYTWDGADHMASRREPLNRITNFSYDPLGNLLSESVGGRSTSYTYNAFGERTSKRRGTTEYTYTNDGEGNLLTETDPLGRTITRTYNALNLELTRSGPLGSGKLFTYDPAGRLIIETTLNSTGQQTARYVVDGMGRRIQTTDPSGAVSSTSYDKNGKTVRQVDGRGKATLHTYDAAGNLESTTDPEGHTTNYRYDKNGNRIEETQPNGNVITRTFDAMNREISRRDSIGPLETATFDPAGNKIQTTDAAGAITTHTYNDLNYLTASNQPEGRNIAYTVNIYGEHTSETDPGGRTIEHDYDDLGRLTASIGPGGFQVFYTYDDIGNRLTETNPRGVLASFAYNDLNQLVSQTDPLGTQTFTYDTVGNKLSATDRMGIVESWNYDKMNRRKDYNRAGVLLERQTWDPAGNRASVSDANGNPTSFEYDGRNLMIRENRPNLAVTRYERDAMGDVTTETQPAGRVVRRSFDKRRRRLTETNGAGEQRTFAYDDFGNTIEVEKPQGTWTMTYDLANRLTSVSDPLGHTASYTYDSRDNMLTQTLGGHTTTFEYDDWKRRIGKRYADGTQVSFSFDQNGNQLGYIEPNGNSASFVYDDLDRLVTESFSGTGGNLALTHTLDKNGNRLLTNVTDASGSFQERRTFDSFNRMTVYTDPYGRNLQLSYDPQGNRLTMRDFNNIPSTYSYDALNRLESLAVSGMGTWNYSYFANSLLRQVDHPNGTVSEYAYDLANRVTTLTNRHDGGIVSNHLYTYDNGGRRIRLEETNGGTAQVTTYSHDAADRLTGVTYPASSVTYTLDAAGNRLTETRDGVTLTYNYNNRFQLTDVSGPSLSTTYSYDPSGNLTGQTHNGQARTYSYDARNRLAAFAGDGLPNSTYRYDTDGRRIARTINGDTTFFSYDGDDLIAELSASATLARYHYGASRRLGENRAGSRAFFLQDVLGTPVALTATDGTVLTRYLYDAWGKLVQQSGSSAQPFGFTGYQRDGESGLYYARNRYYDAGTGRFLREDPYAGDTKQPSSLHPYLYGSANPTLVVDPSGLYGEGGHYYTTYFVARVVGYSAKEAATLAMFSQLPDEVGRYDAINQVVNRSLISMSLGSGGPYAMPSQVTLDAYTTAQKQLVDVQQGLHALTGTHGPTETRITRGVVRDYIQQGELEAAGIAIHRLGDTFAHRRITKEKGKVVDGDVQVNTYDTGLGHGGDGHDPDQIHRRPELYRNYVQTLAETISKTPLTQEQLAQLAKLDRAVVQAKQDSYRIAHTRAGNFPYLDDDKADGLTRDYIRNLSRDFVDPATGKKDSVLLNPEESADDYLYYLRHAGDEASDIGELLKVARQAGIDVDKATGGYNAAGIQAQLAAKAEKVIRRVQEERQKAGPLGQKEVDKEKERERVRQENRGVLREEPVWSLDQGLGPYYP